MRRLSPLFPGGVVRRVARLGAPALLLALALPLAAPAPAHADETTCTRDIPDASTTSTDVDPVDDESDPSLRALRLDAVHKIATGAGIGVAVIDSGVQPGPPLEATVGPSYVGNEALVDGHGTLVAGLVAGAGDITGLAPDAEVVSLRVSSAGPDPENPQPGDVAPDDVARAIDWAVSNRSTHGIRVVNLSLGLPEASPAISRALARAERAGVVVVAAAGDRVAEQGVEEGGDAPTPVPDDVLFPASVDTVLAVTARDADLVVDTERMLMGPEIDVSAPVVGLRSVMLRGVVCDVTTPSSGLAAAQVSALAALVLEQDASLTAAQVRTRIEATAQGGHRDSATDGHGMIQPHAALTAVLDIDPDGTLIGGDVGGSDDFRAAAPQAPDDAYAGTRGRLLWWGVGGGGLVVLALLLRPLTAGRVHPGNTGQ